MSESKATACDVAAGALDEEVRRIMTVLDEHNIPTPTVVARVAEGGTHAEVCVHVPEFHMGPGLPWAAADAAWALLSEHYVAPRWLDLRVESGEPEEVGE